MTYKKLTFGLLPLLMVGCAAYNGSYWPGCTAFVGNNVILTGQRFVWDKYTDAMKIDGDGNIIDAFPGYPKRGTYRIEGTTVIMRSESGEAMPTMHLARHGGRPYLLTDAQFTSWQESGIVEMCALTRSRDDKH